MKARLLMPLPIKSMMNTPLREREGNWKLRRTRRAGSCGPQLYEARTRARRCPTALTSR